MNFEFSDLAHFKSNFQKVVLLDEIERYVRISVIPISKQKMDGLYLIFFQEEDSANFKYFSGKGLSSENPQNLKLEDDFFTFDPKEYEIEEEDITDLR